MPPVPDGPLQGSPGIAVVARIGPFAVVQPVIHAVKADDGRPSGGDVSKALQDDVGCYSGVAPEELFRGGGSFFGQVITWWLFAFAA